MNAFKKKKKPTFKITSSCTNMESYSHLGINQHMNHRKRESVFCFVFFSVTFFFPPSKGKSVHTATLTNCSWVELFSSLWLVDCHASVDPTNCLIINPLRRRPIVHFPRRVGRQRVTPWHVSWDPASAPCITQTQLVSLVKLNNTMLHLGEACHNE